MSQVIFSCPAESIKSWSIELDKTKLARVGDLRPYSLQNWEQEEGGETSICGLSFSLMSYCLSKWKSALKCIWLKQWSLPWTLVRKQMQYQTINTRRSEQHDRLQAKST